MSTRGLVVIRSNNEIKVAQYNHSDSYIEWLGVHIQDFIRNLIDNKTLFEKFKDNVNNSAFHNDRERDELDGEQVLADLLITPVSSYNSFDFLDDHLFCEYGYIIDLDVETVDIYKKGKVFKTTFSGLSEINLKVEFENWYHKNFEK